MGLKWVCFVVFACVMCCHRSMAFVEVCTKSLLYNAKNATFCYHITTFGKEDFLNEKQKDRQTEWDLMKSRCQQTWLQLGGVARQAAVLSINEDAEKKFIYGKVTAASDHLRDSGDERGLSVSSLVLLGADSGGFWLDKSDHHYLHLQITDVLQIAKTGSFAYLNYGKKFYENLEINKAITKEVYIAGTYSLCVCKARFPFVSREPIAQLYTTVAKHNRIGRCVRNKTALFDGDKQWCYALVPISRANFDEGQWFLNERTVAAEICRKTRVLVRDEIWATALVSLHNDLETNFVRQLVESAMAKSQPPKERGFSSRIVLGAVDSGWMDGSDTAFGTQKFHFKDLSDITCAFYDVSKQAFFLSNCGKANDYYPGATSFAICKSVRQVVQNEMVAEVDTYPENPPSPWDHWRPGSGGLRVADSALLCSAALCVALIVNGI